MVFYVTHKGSVRTLITHIPRTENIFVVILTFNHASMSFFGGNFDRPIW